MQTDSRLGSVFLFSNRSHNFSSAQITKSIRYYCLNAKERNSFRNNFYGKKFAKALHSAETNTTLLNEVPLRSKKV